MINTSLRPLLSIWGRREPLLCGTEGRDGIREARHHSCVSIPPCFQMPNAAHMAWMAGPDEGWLMWLMAESRVEEQVRKVGAKGRGRREKSPGPGQGWSWNWGAQGNCASTFLSDGHLLSRGWLSSDQRPCTSPNLFLDLEVPRAAGTVSRSWGGGMLTQLLMTNFQGQERV